MDDLEIVKLCADEMGIDVTLQNYRGTIQRYYFMDGRVQMEYNPLFIDEQCFALIKRFGLDIEAPSEMTGTQWEVYKQEHITGKPIGTSTSTDLNRAICLCVAQLRKPA